MLLRHRHAPFVTTLVTVGALLTACGQAPQPGAVSVAETTSATAVVGSGASCIPDLNTSHVSVVGLRRGDATGIVPSGVTAQQVREGTVPPPPESRLVTAGAVPLPVSSNGTQAGGLGVGQPGVRLYQTDCGSSDIRRYYAATLLQDQWIGGFTPATDAGSAASIAAPSGAARSGTNLTLFDFAALETGRFINVHPSGDTAAFIVVLPAIESPGSPLERHPTYVEVLTQPSPSTSTTKQLPPSIVTTPNTGVSALPPGGP